MNRNLPSVLQIDDDNRCHGDWWGTRHYGIAGERWHVCELRDEPFRYSVSNPDRGSIKLDGDYQVIEIFHDDRHERDLTRERAEAVAKTLRQLVYLEQVRADEYADRQAKNAAAYEVYGSQFPHLRGGAFVRPPEPVYPPGDITVMLTPVPRNLLVALRDGARLHERAWRWTEWRLQMPGQDPQRIRERGIEALRRVAFIQRDGVLPPGRLPQWFEFDWSITDAGAAWLDVHAKPKVPDAQKKAV